jgi:hypothetical protein
MNQERVEWNPGRKISPKLEQLTQNPQFSSTMKFMESRSKRNEAEPHTEARLNSSTEESNESEEPPQPARWDLSGERN